MALTGKPDATLATEVTNDGWWPDITLGNFLDRYRIGNEYADDIISHAVTLALMDVNTKLAGVKAVLEVDYADLDAYATAQNEQLNGLDVCVLQYEQAVFCWAKAWLLMQAMTLNRKDNAEQLAKESPQTQAFWMAQAQTAIDWFFTKTGVDTDGVYRLDAHVALL